MLIHVKQSFEIKNKDGEKYSSRNGDIVTPPEWVVHNAYFKALCDSGKITVHVDSRTIEEASKEESKGDKNKKK